MTEWAPDIELQNKIMEKITVTKNGCWEWNAYRHPTGYGRMGVRRYPTKWAHRLSFLAFTGPLSTLSICHRCDNPPCCNPDHLFSGTQKENADDMMHKMRHPLAYEAIKTHCKSGHLFSGENLSINSFNGQRVCNICIDASRRKWVSKQDPEALRIRQREAVRRYAAKKKLEKTT